MPEEAGNPQAISADSWGTRLSQKRYEYRYSFQNRLYEETVAPLSGPNPLASLLVGKHGYDVQCSDFESGSDVL